MDTTLLLVLCILALLLAASAWALLRLRAGHPGLISPAVRPDRTRPHPGTGIQRPGPPPTG